MKYAAIALLLAIPALADWRWEGRDEAREAVAEARRARMEARREVMQARARFAKGNGVGKSRMAR